VGVQYAWLVHPQRRTLEAYRLHDGKWLAIAVHKDDDRARIEPFDALELDLASLWADLPLPTRVSEQMADHAYGE
jgi:Uma2 family endonuclease